jgi:hypothetical protein
VNTDERITQSFIMAQHHFADSSEQLSRLVLEKYERIKVSNKFTPLLSSREVQLSLVVN